MHDVIISMWSIVCELAPWLFLGAFVSGILHVLVPSTFVQRHLGQPGIASVVKAALIGVPMPLCSCSVIPTAIALKKDGAGNGAALSFLISTPQTGIDSIAITAAFLGWPFALFKVFAAFITGVIGGLLAGAHEPGEASASAQTEAPAQTVASCCGGNPTPTPIVENPTPSCCGGTSPSTPAPRHTLMQQATTAIHFAVWDLLHAIWRWLCIGVIISACITVYLPQWLPTADISDSSKLLTMCMVLLISIPMYVCATASVPIAAALVSAGFPMGAALVFLMAGPATNIATLGAVATHLGKRSLIVYLGIVIVASISLGISYDLFLYDLFPQTIVAATDHHHHGQSGSWLGTISATLFLALCVVFLIHDLGKRFGKQGSAADASSCCGGT